MEILSENSVDLIENYKSEEDKILYERNRFKHLQKQPTSITCQELKTTLDEIADMFNPIFS